MSKGISRFVRVLRLMKYIKGYKFKFAASISINLLYKIMPVATGFIVSLMVGYALSGQYALAQSLFVASIVLVFACAGLHYFDILIAHDMAYRILRDMRSLMYQKIDEIAPAATEDKQSGDLLSVVLEDVELLEWFYAHTISQITVAFFVPLSGLILLGTFHWSFPVALLIFITLLLIIPTSMGKRSNKQGAAVRAKLGGLNARSVDGIQGIKDIISFRWHKHYFNIFSKSAKEYNTASIAYESRAAGERGLILLIISASSLAVTVITISLITAGMIEAYWFLPLLSVSALIFIPLTEALNMSTNYGNIFAAAGRVFDVLQIEPCVNDTGTLKSKDILKTETVVVKFDDIHFHYPSRNKSIENPIVLSGVDFSFATGESIALVGASGGGKSTCAKLMQRFWDVDAGQITISGVNIKDFEIDALRAVVTLVPQDIYLFNMTVLENLLLAKPDATDEEIIIACREAQADSFIDNLPDGINTMIGERGLRLSGGEKQRLAIAQAFLKNSPILILDEASASLDAENERMINEAVRHLKAGRATLVIAHRVSTIRSADRIVVLNNGAIADSGTYDELMVNCPCFAELIGGRSE